MQLASREQSILTRRRGEDPLRNVARVEYEIEVERRTSVPGHPRLFGEGVHRVVIYEDQEELLLAKVEDRHEEREQAEKANRVAFERALAARVRPNMTEWERAKRQNDLEQEWGGSAEAVFAERYEDDRRLLAAKKPPERTGQLVTLGMRPIKRATKIRELPAPELDEKRMIRETVESLAGAIGGGGVVNNNSGESMQLLSELAAKVDQLAAENAEMKAELQRRKGGRPRKDRETS